MHAFLNPAFNWCGAQKTLSLGKDCPITTGKNDRPQNRSRHEWRHPKHQSSNWIAGITVSTLIVTYILNLDFKWRQQVSLTLCSPYI